MPSQHYQGEKVSQEASFINEISRHMIWYQEKRIKQSLGAISPIEFIKSLGLVAWSKKISALPTSGEPYFPRTLLKSARFPKHNWPPSQCLHTEMAAFLCR